MLLIWIVVINLPIYGIGKLVNFLLQKYRARNIYFWQKVIAAIFIIPAALIILFWLVYLLWNFSDALDGLAFYIWFPLLGILAAVCGAFNFTIKKTALWFLAAIAICLFLFFAIVSPLMTARAQHQAKIQTQHADQAVQRLLNGN